MSTITTLLIAVVLTEAITEIVSKSELFSPLREFLFNRRKTSKLFKFTHALLDCGYCLSVWVGIIVGILLVDITLLHPAINWFFTGLLIHRLSNVLHNVIDRTRDLTLFGEGD